MRTAVKLESVGALIEGCHENPFDLLGPHEIDHEGGKALAVRAYLPHSNQAWLAHRSHGARQPLRRIHPSGVYEAICPWPGEAGRSRYQLHVEDFSGQQMTIHDPYAFPSLLTDFDLHLLSEGRHYRAYDKMGAHPRTVDGVSGVNFAVWAPNARGVSVVGDFNGCDGRRHLMRKHIPSGVWELFVPGIDAGERYKYRVNQHGHGIDKCDPYGFAAEVPPRTASLVSNLDKFSWKRFLRYL